MNMPLALLNRRRRGGGGVGPNTNEDASKVTWDSSADTYTQEIYS